METIVQMVKSAAASQLLRTLSRQNYARNAGIGAVAGGLYGGVSEGGFDGMSRGAMRGAGLAAAGTAGAKYIGNKGRLQNLVNQKVTRGDLRLYESLNKVSPTKVHTGVYAGKGVGAGPLTLEAQNRSWYELPSNVRELLTKTNPKGAFSPLPGVLGSTTAQSRINFMNDMPSRISGRFAGMKTPLADGQLGYAAAAKAKRDAEFAELSRKLVG